MYKTILSPIIAKDKAGNSQINEYKKNAKMQSSKSEKKKGDGLIMPTPIIRIHGPRTSNQTFIEDMYYAVEEVDGKPIHLHMFTFDSELENNARLNSGSAGWQDKSVLELKAFHNEEDSQQYKNMDSISGPFDVFWNFVYTGTPVALGKKVNNNNFGSGLSTRLAVLPLCSDTFKPLPFRKQSKVNILVIDDLKAWAFKFDEVSGELPVWPLVEHTYHWIVEMLANAKQNDDKVSALLSKRVPYYGINVSVPFILMRHWDEWKEAKTFVIDEKDKELCSIVMEIQYASQVFFFGTMAKTYLFNKDMDVNSTERYFSKAKKLFDIMPSEFNRHKLMEIGQLTEGAARIQLHRWIKENLISGKGAGKKAIYNKIH